MDPKSRKRKLFAHHRTVLLNWDQLAQFLKTRRPALESGNAKQVSQQASNQNAHEIQYRVYIASVSCIDDCNKEHKLHEWLIFTTRSIPERFNVVKAKRGCSNCLRIGVHI